MTGVEMIAAERERQQSEENFTVGFDCTEREPGMLARAGECYVATAADQLSELDDLCPTPSALWPFAKGMWKPSTDPRRNLVRAGALIAAELDRMEMEGDDVRL